MSKPGTIENPHKRAPADWLIHGVPYGDFCECGNCGFIGRSTYCFDYFADAPGDELACERCTTGQTYAAEAILSGLVDSEPSDG